MLTIVYLMNRSPNTTIELKTLMEKWTNQVLDFNNLRSFGCVAYPHIKEDKLGKRDLNAFS